MGSFSKPTQLPISMALLITKLLPAQMTETLMFWKSIYVFLATGFFPSTVTTIHIRSLITFSRMLNNDLSVFQFLTVALLCSSRPSLMPWVSCSPRAAPRESLQRQIPASLCLCSPVTLELPPTCPNTQVWPCPQSWA